MDKNHCRLRLKCDGTRAETRIRLSTKRTSPFKSAGASVQSTTGSRGVRISGSNAEYTKFQRSVKGTGYPLHSPVSPSLPLPCVTVCHHVSTGLYPCLPLLTNAIFCKFYSIILLLLLIIIIINTACTNTVYHKCVTHLQYWKSIQETSDYDNKSRGAESFWEAKCSSCRQEILHIL